MLWQHLFAYSRERTTNFMAALITLVVGLFVVVALLSALAQRLQIPAAIVLVLGGVLLSFIPGVPTIDLNPDLVLFLFLPPLIYAAAWQTSWREFRATLRPILLLAIGLVLVTTTTIAVVAHYVIGLPWSVGFVLGAIVSPTDAVAASATAQSLGLSRRIVTVLEGESMVNDATGLVIYRFAVAAVVMETFSLWQASWQFVVVSIGGLLIGLVIAWPLARLHRMFDDALIEITLTLLTPFVAYLCAEALHLSGVLATLSAGLYLSRQSARFFSSNTRLQATAVWNVLVFLLNGLLFLLIGLQLRSILATIGPTSGSAVIRDALVICLTVILVRVVWIFTATYLPQLLSARAWAVDSYSSWRNVLLVAWAGLRGGLSLAAALALPLMIAGGTAFPEREHIIFLTFCVIVATLVVQGLSLVPLIRLLGIQADRTPEQERIHARQVALHAALARLDELAAEDGVSDRFIAHLRSHYEEKLDQVLARRDGEEEQDTAIQQRIQKEVMNAERAAVIRLRDQGQIDDEVLRMLERELDLEDQRLRS
jgi:monovalent cation/hydrogen antiporter